MALVRVKVTPGAREDSIIGWHGDTLRVRVRAPAERGKANDAICRLLARALGLPPSAVSIDHGAASREKTILIDGMDDHEVQTTITGAIR